MNQFTITHRQKILPCILQNSSHYQPDKRHKKNISQPNLNNNILIIKHQQSNKYVKNLKQVSEFKKNRQKTKNKTYITDNSQKCDEGIRQYLDLLKHKRKMINETKVEQKKQIVHCEQSKTYIKRSHIKLSKNLSPRLTKYSPFEKIERDIILNIEKILLYYQYLKEYGYANSKILALIKRFCHNKTDIQKIFIKSKKINIFKNQQFEEYKQNKDDILKSFLDVLSKRNGDDPEQLFYFFYEFKNQLEKQVIHQATNKIQQISNFILQNQTNQLILNPKLSEFSQIYEKINFKKDQIYDIQLQIKKIQKFYGIYKNISEVNRRLYQILTQKNQIIQTQIQNLHFEYLDL